MDLWTICGFCARDMKMGEVCPHSDDFGTFNLIISGTGKEGYKREFNKIGYCHFFIYILTRFKLSTRVRATCQCGDYLEMFRIPWMQMHDRLIVIKSPEPSFFFTKP